MALENYELARQDFAAAIQIEPGYALSYYARGLAEYYLQQYDEATQDFNTYLELAPASEYRALIEQWLAEMNTAPE